MTQKIPDELWSSSFQFLDRMQLLTLQEGTSRGIYSKIDREFENEPYLMISDLNYDYLSGVEQTSFYINTENTSDNQTEFLDLIIKRRYLRSYRSHITYDLTSLDLLKSISHLWNGHNLILNSSSLQLSPELFRLILTSFGWLELKFEGSLSYSTHITYFSLPVLWDVQFRTDYVNFVG